MNHNLIVCILEEISLCFNVCFIGMMLMIMILWYNKKKKKKKKMTMIIVAWPTAFFYLDLLVVYSWSASIMLYNAFRWCYYVCFLLFREIILSCVGIASMITDLGWRGWRLSHISFAGMRPLHHSPIWHWKTQLFFVSFGINLGFW